MTTTETAAKPASPDKAEQASDARQLDERLRHWAKIAADNLVKVSGLIAEAKAKAIWKLVTDPDTGKPFANWQSYISSVIGREMEPLAAVNRNALIKMLLDEGLSQRAAAEAAKTSPATVNEVAKGRTPGERQPKAESEPSQPAERRTLSARVGEFLDQVSRRMDEIATTDLEVLDKRFVVLHRECAATLKKRADATKRSPATNVTARKATPTQARQASKARHPAGSRKPADAA